MVSTPDCVAWELVEINVARLRAPLDDPQLADFTNNLDRINALAESSTGFVWRLQTEDGNATAMRPYEDETVIINVSMWVSVASLGDYVYRSGHVDFLRRKREWFHRFGEAAVALWWVPAGERPTLAYAVDRLDHLRAYGPTARAFTFAKPFPAPGSAEQSVVNLRDACPAEAKTEPLRATPDVEAVAPMLRPASAPHPRPSAPTLAATRRRR